MTDDHLAEHVPEIGRDREVALFEQRRAREPRPGTMDFPAANARSDREHHVAVAVIGAAVAVLSDRTSELRHGEHEDVVGGGPEVAAERGERSAERLEV